MTHLPQPLHLLRSIAIAHLGIGILVLVGHIDGPPSGCSVPAFGSFSYAVSVVVGTIGRRSRSMTSEPCAIASVLVTADLADADGQPRREQPAVGEQLEREGVGPDAVADDPARGAAEAEWQGHLVVVHARVPVGRRDDLRVARVDLDQVAVGQLHLVEAARRDRHRAAPGDAGDGIGELVQPAVVAGAAVLQREVRVELQFELRGRRRGPLGQQRERCRRERRVPPPEPPAPATRPCAARRSTRSRTPPCRRQRPVVAPTRPADSDTRALVFGARLRRCSLPGTGVLAVAARHCRRGRRVADRRRPSRRARRARRACRTAAG